MARKRKYEKVSNYWVYSIKVPSINKYYIGVSKQQCYHRWCKTYYKGMALEPYLDEWDSMIKTVLVDNLTKEQAYQYEDNILRALSINNLCINTNRSGLIEVSDINAYNREYKKQLYENNPEYREREIQRAKQWRLDNPEYHKQYYKRKKLEKQQHTSVH